MQYKLIFFFASYVLILSLWETISHWREEHSKIYSVCHRVRKVRATHIMLDRRTTIMAFIQCTDLQAATTCCQQSRKHSMPLQKSSQLSLFK